MTICNITKCVFDSNIECCDKVWCKRHYKEHSSMDPKSHQGKKLYHEINVESTNEILNWLHNVKSALLDLQKRIIIHWIENIDKDYPGNFLTIKINEVMISCRELEIKVTKTPKVPIKICYNPIEYFLTQPLEKTKIYLQSLNLDFSDISFLKILENLEIVQNHLYNYNYLVDVNDFHGGEILNEEELITELFNIAGSLLYDDEYYQAKCLYKECRRIFEKIKYHKKIDLFFIDYYIYMINRKIKRCSKKCEPVPRPENFTSPYFLEFLEFISRIYLDWNRKHRSKRFLKKHESISKSAFKTEYDYNCWMSFWTGIVYLYGINFKKSFKYLEDSEIYFKNTDQLSYLALSEYLLGYLHIIKIKAGDAKFYLKKSKIICKDLKLGSLLEKIYFILGYLAIFEMHFGSARKYLKKGKILCNGYGKHYDIALFKLDIWKANLVSPFDYSDRIKRDFIVFPLQNPLVGWLHAEIGLIYFFLGDIKGAEIYLNSAKLAAQKPSNLVNTINLSLNLLLFYSFKKDQAKIEELLRDFKKNFAHLTAEIKLYLFIFEVMLRCIFHIKSERINKEFEERKNEMIKYIWKKDQFIYNPFNKILFLACNIDRYDNLGEKLLDHAISMFNSSKSPLLAYLFIIKSSFERSIGNHEASKAYLVKAKKMLEFSMSQKNNQVKIIEKQLKEVEEEIAMQNSEK